MLRHAFTSLPSIALGNAKTALGRTGSWALPLGALALCAPGLGQGDECSTPTAVSGFGPFAFDNSTASTSGFNGAGGCSSLVRQDQFFLWTAPAGGDYYFDTFGSNFDTLLSVHAGTNCGATCIGSNDNAGGTLESEVGVLGVSAGDTLLVQVGSFYLFSGPGILNVTLDNSACNGLTPDALEPNDQCSSPATLSAGSHTGLTAFQGDSDFYAITVAPGEWLEAQVSSDNPGDVDLRLYEPGCNLVQSDPAIVRVLNFDSSPTTYIVEAFVDTASSGAPCATYDLAITTQPDPCFGVPDDGFEDNDRCQDALSLGDAMVAGMWVSKWDKDIFRVCVPPQSTITIDLLFTHANGDIDIFLQPDWSFPCAIGAAGIFFEAGRTLSDNESIVWSNPFPFQQNCYLEVQVYADSPNSCNQYDLIVQGSEGCTIGQRFCNPAANNSTGLPATMSAHGSIFAADNALILETSQLPPNQFGYYLASQGTGILHNPGGSIGNLCLNGGLPIARFNQLGQVGSSGSEGYFEVPIDITQVPAGGSSIVAIQAGESWNFQAWYRDWVGGQSVSNFSDALLIRYQ